MQFLQGQVFCFRYTLEKTFPSRWKWKFSSSGLDSNYTILAAAQGNPYDKRRDYPTKLEMVYTERCCFHSLVDSWASVHKSF